MRIGILFKSLDSGGAENRTLELLRVLTQQKKEYKFYIFTYSKIKGELFEEYSCLNNTEIINIRKINFLKLITILKSLNIFISNLYLFSGLIMFFLSLLGVKKRISYIRTYIQPVNTLERLKYSILKVLMKKFSTNIISVSESVRNQLQLTTEKCLVIYNGFDLSKVKSNIQLENREKYNAPPINIIHIGRYNQAKNHEFILEFFKKYKENKRDAKLLLIGKNVESYMVNRDLDLKDITFLDYTNDISKFILQSDLFILPSLREGLPGVLVEAGSTNIPIITSDIMPNVEISKYYNNAVCKPLDVDIWIDEALKIKKRKIEFTKKEEFTMNNYVKKIISIIEN